MHTNILAVEGLSHKYSNHWAIRNISFEIGQTGILGLLGSNGAGKSTTMNIMSGVLSQTAGKVIINGVNLREKPELAKKDIGFLPQQAPLYKELTVDEYLLHAAYLRQIGKGNIKSAVAAAKEKCGITHCSSRLIKNLSGGYQQRVGIAQAIIHQPKLVILDEPTNGLDPNQIIEVRALIKEIAQERAVIFSTHILSEVQALCKEIRMIEQGQLVFADTMEAFNNYIAPASVRIEMDAPPEQAALLQITGITKVELISARCWKLYFDGDRSITQKIIQASVQHGWQLNEIYLEKGGLDEIFAQLSNNSKDA